MSHVAETGLKPRPRGAAVFGLLLALYYGTVVLSSAHFAVLQIVTLWGIVLIFLPAYRASLTHGEWRLLLSVTAIFAVALLSYAVNGFGAHPEANLSRYLRFLFFIPIYLAARNFATVNGFWIALLLGTLATGLWGLLELAGLVRAADDIWPEVSGAVNPIQFGDLSLALAAMTCAGLPMYRQFGRPILMTAGCAVALALFACLASATRGAWIAVPALAVLLLWGFVHGGWVRPRHLLAIAVVALLLLANVTLRTNFPDQVQSAVKELRDYRQGKVGASVGVRLELWRASWAVFQEHPVFGVGPGLYKARVGGLMAERGGHDAKMLAYSHPHSEYFFVLVTLGSLGLLSLALLFLVPLYRFGRAMLSDDNGLRWPGLAGAVMVLAYLQFGLTEALMFQHASFLGFYLLSVAVLAALIGRRQRELMTETNG